MLYNDRIDLSERIDINKISASKECYIFHRWYLLDKRRVCVSAEFLE